MYYWLPYVLLVTVCTTGYCMYYWLPFVLPNLTLKVLCFLPHSWYLCAMWFSQSAVTVFLTFINRNSPLFVPSAGTAWLSAARNPLLWLSSFPDPTSTQPSCPPFLQPVQPCVAGCVLAPVTSSCPLTRTASYWVWYRRFSILSACAAGSHPIQFVPLVPSMCACRILHDPPPPATHSKPRIFVKKKIPN
jgi:hypothetical protein